MAEGRSLLKQKLAVGLYCWFIFYFAALNILLLVANKWTRLAWIGYALYINLHRPARSASKNASWPKPLRKWRFWRHFADYFPCTLHKTADLDPQQRYIFAVHPHGIGTVFAWPVFDTDACAFSVKFPGIDVYPMTLEFNFRVPLIREWLLLHGVADASKEACLSILGRGPGKALLLAVGGAQEALLSAPGTMDLILRKRKGFVKVALQTGARLVPVVGFGEPDLLVSKPQGPLLARASALTKAVAGFTLPAFEGAGFFTDKGIMPYRKPLNVVVGAPVVFDVQRCPGGEQVGSLEEMVDAYHAQYMEALQALWAQHAPKYAPGVELRFVE